MRILRSRAIEPFAHDYISKQRSCPKELRKTLVVVFGPEAFVEGRLHGGLALVAMVQCAETVWTSAQEGPREPDHGGGQQHSR